MMAPAFGFLYIFPNHLCRAYNIYWTTLSWCLWRTFLWGGSSKMRGRQDSTCAKEDCGGKAKVRVLQEMAASPTGRPHVELGFEGGASRRRVWRISWVTEGESGMLHSGGRWWTLAFLCPSWVLPFIDAQLEKDIPSQIHEFVLNFSFQTVYNQEPWLVQFLATNGPN